MPGAEQHDPQDAIKESIREALEDSARASRYPARRLVAPDPGRSQRNRRELSTMEERADLVGFALTSRMKRLERVSTGVRQAVRRALLQVLHRQTEFNRAAIELIRSQQTQLDALGASVRAQIDIQAGADERLRVLEHRLPARSGLAELDYLSFRERFHGTTQARRERLSRFVAWFEGCSEVVDAGCGRGEFLELLREAGVDSVGVDSDAAMVDRCRQAGLDAIHDDVLQFLRGRLEESHGGIFASHLVEHLERGEIVELVRLAFARLRPGGVLVLETVNPMCVLTHGSFYDDFTHVAPAPPIALQWLAESSGFTSVEIEYASPVPAEHKLRPLPASAGGAAEVEAFNRGIDGANELLFGFQEYALFAHKPR
jgi:2-polyprenyl-3-methyl-5-hydroxy-6-metoxy-1,4-benzoquinol methylase